MKLACASIAVLMMAAPATAQQFASNDGYRVCPQSQTQQGVSIVEEACGALQGPDFSTASFGSIAELEAARIKREAFTADVSEYGVCVTQFINSYRRPGVPADSQAPDQAACAHSWAEDQATETVRAYGKACIEFSNRSMMDSKIEDFDGECYPSAGNGQG